MTGEDLRPLLARDASLERARVALDRAADELVTVLALDGLPDAIGEGAVEEPRCAGTGTHAEPASARGSGDVTEEPRAGGAS